VVLPEKGVAVAELVVAPLVKVRDDPDHDEQVGVIPPVVLVRSPAEPLVRVPRAQRVECDRRGDRGRAQALDHGDDLLLYHDRRRELGVGLARPLLVRRVGVVPQERRALGRQAGGGGVVGWEGGSNRQVKGKVIVNSPPRDDTTAEQKGGCRGGRKGRVSPHREDDLARQPHAGEEEPDGHERLALDGFAQHGWCWCPKRCHSPGRWRAE